MSLIKHRTKAPRTLDPFGNLDDIFSNFFVPMKAVTDIQSDFMSPKVDVHESKSGFEIKADLPGLEKDQVHVSLDDGIVTIEAETSAEEEQKDKEDGHVLRRERRYGKYLRRFDLGANLAESDATAGFKNGVLTLNIPKATPDKKVPKKLEIT